MRSVLLVLSLALVVCSSACQHKQPQTPFPVIDPAATGIDLQALDALRTRAQETHSDALVVVQDGRLVLEHYSNSDAAGRGGDPIEGMSTTKSVLSLAVGRLLADGHLQSIDQPVTDFFPEWEAGAGVSVRHLLQHTSGICGDPTTEAIYGSDDFVAHALAVGLCSAPGEAFFYNNNASNLLAGLVQRASGKALDTYLGDTLFRELGIERYSWTRDRSGNPHGMAGLQIRAIDLARIGQMMLDQGRWQGRQLLPQAWIEASIQPGPVDPGAGLLWWLVPAWDLRSFDDALFDQWRGAGVEEDFIERMQPLSGRSIPRADLAQTMPAILGDSWRQQVRSALGARGLPIGRPDRGPAVAFEANGYLGQYLMVVPATRMVAVRQIRHDSHRGDADSFEEFRFMVMKLTQVPTESGAAAPSGTEDTQR